MLKQTLVSLLAITSLTLSIQANAHQENNRHGVARHHWHQPAPKPVKPKFNVNAAQAHQAALINNGVKNRKLTRYEEQKLRQQQADIARLEHKLNHSGLTKWERNTLKQKLAASGRLIHSYLNNREYRKDRRHHRGHHGHNNITWKKSSGHSSFSISIGH